MERNDELGNVGNTGSEQDRGTGGTGFGAGGTGFGGQTGGTDGSLGYGAGSGDGSSGLGTGGSGAEGRAEDLKDRARDLASNAQSKLADVGSRVRDGAGNVKNSLANALEGGANRLRSSDTSDIAGLSASGAATATDGRMHQVTDGLASGMQASAEWLRETDLDSMKRGVEEQVRTHPGRTLLVAVGLGYLLGKAFRR
jgi:ElaB/YqjD/DUF883 family membrane-anchored ribosome-binding protein